MVDSKDIAGQECTLITCCEEEDLSVLGGVHAPMGLAAAMNKWKMVDEVLVSGVLKPTNIDKTNSCQ